MKLTIRLYVVTRIGVNGAVPLRPFTLFIAWCKTLPLLSHVTVLVNKIFKPEKPVVISFKHDQVVDVGVTRFTNEFYIHGSIHRESNLIIAQQVATYSDGSRSGYVKTILLISVVLFPKYFIITKSGIHTVVLNDFVCCVFR